MGFGFSVLAVSDLSFIFAKTRFQVRVGECGGNIIKREKFFQWYFLHATKKNFDEEKIVFAIMTTQIFVQTVKNVDVFRERIVWFCFEFSSEMEDFLSDP